MSHRLEIYVADYCYGCTEAHALAGSISAQFPELQVEVISLAAPGTERPASVFAVPTYLLNGELLWLGNPRREDAIGEIQNILEDN